MFSVHIRRRLRFRSRVVPIPDAWVLRPLPFPVVRIGTDSTSHEYPLYLPGLTYSLVAYNMEFLLQVRTDAS